MLGVTNSTSYFGAYSQIFLEKVQMKVLIIKDTMFVWISA